MARTVPVPESSGGPKLRRFSPDAATRGRFKRSEKLRVREVVAGSPSLAVATLAHIGTHEKPRNLEAELTRYVLGIADLQDAARGARYLAEAPWLELSPPVRRCLITGTFTSYWRPFTNKGYPRLPELDLSEDQKRLHTWAGKQRNRIWAHTTPGSTRKVEIDAAPRTTRGSIRIKSMPPTKREYVALAELAEHLIERYRAVVDEIDSPP